MRADSIQADERCALGAARCAAYRGRLGPGALVTLGIVLVLSGCSVRQYALNRASDALAGTGKSFASDDDPELIAEASPFGLKLMDSLLEQNPKHIGLLTAAARGYTQYTFAFVQQDAEMLEDTDIAAATEQLGRARNLYARARAYALRGLDVDHPGMSAALAKAPKDAVKPARKADVPLLYWSAAATGAWIGLSKDSPAAVSQLPSVEAQIDRALELDEAWDAGAIHTFLISYELNRPQRNGDPVARARAHFQRAVELSEGQQAAPYVALAESVCVSIQDRAEFERILKQAVAIDVNARPQWRLANVVMQQRARWLLSRTDQLFAE
ncbi:MAG TPA: TRAP transporter TatT component family protein [Burkholderiales bacterium]|nr:TRAP transporter TatT component family protein [Burkholderiales bacterium]